MISSTDFLKAVKSEEKQDWRYNQLPQYARDFIDTQYLHIEEILKEKEKISEKFQALDIPAQKFSEEDLRKKFNDELIFQTEVKCKDIVDFITERFNSMFGLSVSTYRIKEDLLFYKESEKWKKKEEFLKAYYELGNITNINQAGIEKIKDDFHDIVHRGWRDLRFCGKILNKRIKFEGVIWYNHVWDDGRLAYDGKARIRNFFKALEWFEDNSDTNDILLNCFFDDERLEIPIFHKKELNENFYRKIRGFRSYKNGSIDIYFSSDEIKENFIRTFNLKVDF